MNKVYLIGNLTRDVELTTTTSGINCARFTLAVQRRFANANGEKEVDFINIVAWRQLADNCNKFLSKGKKCAVCGTLQTRSYENKDGVKVNTFDIVADEVEFLTPKQSDDIEEVEVSDSDLPF